MGEQLGQNSSNKQVNASKKQNFQYGKAVPEYESIARKDFPKHALHDST